MKLVICPKCKEEYESYAKPHKNNSVIAQCSFCKSKEDRDRAREKRNSLKKDMAGVKSEARMNMGS